MGKLKIGDNEYEIPAIARGAVIPPKIEKMILEEEQKQREKDDDRRWELEKERRQFRHDWKIAVFSAFAGALLSRPLWDGLDWLLGLFKTILG